MCAAPCVWLFTALLLTTVCSVCGSQLEVLVRAEKPVRNLTHFWRSTGFCPPQPHSSAHLYDLSKDQQLNLALIGSVPHAGLQQVRIHWLLELVSARIINGEYHYNFTYLDELMELLWQNGLQPGFELMGSVNNTFSDFEDKTQVSEWKRLVYLIAQRYIEKYGLDVVSQWNFETWNEPNNHDFDNITMTIQGFLNYYDACLAGLRNASVYLRFGGPGDSCHSPPHSPYCWALLQHCHDTHTHHPHTHHPHTHPNTHPNTHHPHTHPNTHPNTHHPHTHPNTHPNTHSLHYIALHKKGGGGTFPILQQLIDTVQEIQRRFPLFRSLPVYNDEADPLVGWNKPLVWRADVTYAAMVIKVISQHQDLLIADVNNTINFRLLSNDNAFLSYHPHQFTQRTLTARFQINNTHMPHVQLIRKPVLTAMGLLALLGEQQVEVTMVTRDPQEESSVGVNGLRFVSITKGQVLIVWKDHDVGTKCVKTYEVEFSKDGVTFQRINFRDTVFTSHTFSPESLDVCGFYRVRAVDFWGRAGQYSPTERYTEFC
ncbi:hypothetical protein PGIGA_G00144970 [Pangasianodon gigas]|uniref:Uncharacterized protein n=1 Tax=Pangasianodon gigas TaxID=30993 RepID=A0ACC5XMC8_PANGG|nr:hypothetical protein [Pangasianodon gigas]